MSVIKKPRLINRSLHSSDVGGGTRTDLSNNDGVMTMMTTQLKGAVPVSGLYQCGLCSEKFDVPDSLIAHVKKGLHFQNKPAPKKFKRLRSNVNAYEFADVIISPVDSEDDDDDSSKSWSSARESEFGFQDFETDTGSNSSGSSNTIPYMAGNTYAGAILECPQPEVSQTQRLDDGSERKTGSFMCLCCSEVFSSVIVLNNHRVLHGIECKKCNGLFPSKTDYENHVCAADEDNVTEELQEEEAVLINDVGSSKTKVLTPKTFASDVLIEPTDDGWFRCKICSKVCQARSDMSKHVRRHTNERPFSCEICGERFKHQSAISSHLRIHTGEKPYTCSYIGCGKKFSQPSNMRRHEALHRGEKPFICQICEKRFSEKTTLQTHMLQHTGERPFVCNLCGKGHVTNSALKHHMRNRHHPETESSSVDEPVLYPNQYQLKIDYT